MSRMEINTLKTLAEHAEAGGYTLPAELLDAIRTHGRVVTVAIPEPRMLDAETAAARLVARLAAGEEPDVAALVQDAADTEAENKAVMHAQHVAAVAIERAASTATLLASDLTERIIVEHLRPAFDRVLEEARETAGLLAGHSREARVLNSAPAKIRNAFYAKLPDLAGRLGLIREARHKLNTVGHRTPKHDVAGLFGLFADPMALRPGWAPPARIVKLDAPTDPVEFLLWLASDAIAPGRPWLPTIDEADAAWWKQFGEAQETRAQAQRNGQAIGARVLSR